MFITLTQFQKTGQYSEFQEQTPNFLFSQVQGVSRTVSKEAARRQILLIMHFRGTVMTAGEIAERFSCRWPTVSRHMKVLEKAQLVRVDKKGRERFYHLERQRLSVARYWFTSFDQ